MNILYVTFIKFLQTRVAFYYVKFTYIYNSCFPLKKAKYAKCILTKSSLSNGFLNLLGDKINFI